MYNKQFIISIFLLLNSNIYAQNKLENLKEVLITSTRIEVPFSKDAKAITIITNEDIKNATATDLTELLQQVQGISIIRRGIKGMQSDLYIRGGSFEQTLILIDGIKTDDPQTGHHTMNMMISLDNIDHIEIIKGSSSRVFGQNAFTGAINIVTKKAFKNKLSLELVGASFQTKGVEFGVTRKLKKQTHQFNYSHISSDGYRENTDFKNHNFFLKSTFSTKKEPIHVLATFADRKFGAQYFYTSPTSPFTEYEETQTSLIGISTRFHKNNWLIKPKIYWKRNQDVFLLKRDDPAFSRNHNISNKVGAEINTSYKSTIGITGLGIEFAKTSLRSNNLGNQNRTLFSGFLEHRFEIAKEKIDITPGISFHQYSDFGFQTFPGLDIGIKTTKNTRLYWNVGSSFRIPTYTELYINIPNFLSGNKNLKPEKAVSQEFGITYKKSNFKLNTALFYRVSSNVIDYVKETSLSPFYEAKNLRRITTQGFEIQTQYNFKWLNQPQNIQIGYTFIEDDYESVAVYKSRYLLNSTIKNQVMATLKTQFFKNISQSISYRYIERLTNKYTVVDVKINAKLKSFSIFALANNIFDVAYFEKDFVNMPKSNFEFGVKYTLQ